MASSSSTFVLTNIIKLPTHDSVLRKEGDWQKRRKRQAWFWENKEELWAQMGQAFWRKKHGAMFLQKNWGCLVLCCPPFAWKSRKEKEEEGRQGTGEAGSQTGRTSEGYPIWKKVSSQEKMRRLLSYLLPLWKTEEGRTWTPSGRRLSLSLSLIYLLHPPPLLRLAKSIAGRTLIFSGVPFLNTCRKKTFYMPWNIRGTWVVE